MSRRATSPVVGVVLLLLVTVLVATVLGGTVVTDSASTDSPPRVSLTASADASQDRIALTHRSGDPLSVGELRLEISIGGDPLEKQPPIPFFAASGFESGPTGPFNAATDGEWQAGETAAFRLAGTNSPQLSPGVTVSIAVYTDEYKIATLTTRA